MMGLKKSTGMLEVDWGAEFLPGNVSESPNIETEPVVTADPYLCYIERIDTKAHGRCVLLLEPNSPQESVGTVETQRIPCMLNNLRLFAGTSLLEKTLESAVHEKLMPNMLCKAVCVGIMMDEKPPVPIMDVWPYDDVEPKSTDMPFNMSVALKCVEQWRAELKKPPAPVFPGSIVNVKEDGKLSIQYASGEDDTHACYMDGYLAHFKIADLEKRIRCLDKTSAVAGINEKTIYLTEFEGDGNLYRARLQQILLPRQVVVEFIDYGNTETVSMEQVFEASKLDKVLGMIPPLIWQAYMFGVEKIYRTEEALECFQNELDLEFKICAGLRSNHPLVSVTGKEVHGDGRYNMYKLMDSKAFIRSISGEKN